MSNDREMLLDAPDEQPEQAVAPLTDEPEIDTGYDPGNPWWSFCRESQRELEAIYEQRRQQWDALTDEQKAECLRDAMERRKFIREFSVDGMTYAMSCVEEETNIFIIRAMGKERIDREARAAGVESPCSLTVDPTHRTEE